MNDRVRTAMYVIGLDADDVRQIQELVAQQHPQLRDQEFDDALIAAMRQYKAIEQIDKMRKSLGIVR